MGLPNSSDISTYGGILADAVPLIDPNSEISAASLNVLRTDAAAMTRVARRCIFQFTGSATLPTIASTSVWSAGNDAVYGNANAYVPVVARTALGVVTVQLPASIIDALGNTILLNIRTGDARINASTPGFVNVVVTSSSTATLYLFNASGAASDLAGLLMSVELY